MPEVKVEVKNIEDFKLTTKSVKERDMPDRKLVQVSFLADILPADVARVLQIDRAGVAMDITISSPQAVFDLKVEKVNLSSGEIANL